jgi:hypothetical protein
MIATARRFSGGRQAGAEIEAHQGSTLRDLGKMRDTPCRCPSRVFPPETRTAGESCAVLFFPLAWNVLQSPAPIPSPELILAPVELTIVIELASSLGLAACSLSRLELVLGRPP